MHSTESPTAPSRLNEDWLALIIGLGLFLLGLGPLVGVDVLGWIVSTSVWTDITKALGSVSRSWPGVPGGVFLIATYVFLVIVLTSGAAALGVRVRTFAAAFTAVFCLSYAAWIAGSWAYIAATPDKLKSFQIPWSLNLTSE